MSDIKQRKGFFYGWFILAVGFFSLFVATGSRSGFGVFIIPMTDDLGWSRTDISLAISIGILVNGLTQPFIGRLYDRVGARSLITVSLFVLGASVLLLSRTNNLLFLIIVYGFVSSTAASGVSLVTLHAMLAKWFHRKRGLVLSLSTAGGAAGSLVMAPFATYLIILSNTRRLRLI